MSGLLLGLVAVSAQAHISEQQAETGVGLLRMARAAEMIFEGTVTKVEYKNSEKVPKLDSNGAPVLDDAGQPVYVDGSDLPHTFVTFSLDEVLMGRTAGRELTLRFLGGVEEEPTPGVDENGLPVLAPEVLGVGATPLFDVGDRDLLFVQGNGTGICPLVDCAGGRFRLLPGTTRGSAGQVVFTDRGEELRHVGSRVIIGPLQALAAVDRNTIGEMTLDVGRGPEDSTDEPGAGVLVRPNTVIGAQFTEERFESQVHTAIARTHTGAELRRLRPVASADIAVDFTVPPLREAAEDAPDEVAEPSRRPWLNDLRPAELAALLEAERQEGEAFDAGDGNPVLRTGP